jgi:hypothetical protein
MVQKIVILDDREMRDNGTEVVADHSVAFTYDDVTYHLDLTDSNRKRFEGDIAPWVNAASRTVGKPKRSAGRRPASYYAGLRKWCADHGQPLKPNDQGQYEYPPDQRQAYNDFLDQQLPGKG